MTELAQCAKCAALLNDTDEDIAKHRRWHTQLDDAHEAVRRVASNASRDVATLNATVRDYQRPTPAAAPAVVSIRVTDEDELAPDDSDHIIDVDAFDDPESTYVHENVQATIGNPVAGEPAESPADAYPLAIDRDDDDLSARLAHITGAAPRIP